MSVPWFIDSKKIDIDSPTGRRGILGISYFQITLSLNKIHLFKLFSCDLLSAHRLKEDSQDFVLF
jgi:hypothetical protein